MSMAIRKKPITRSRETLTCAQCRIKKLKCDKQYPCASCVKRSEQCSYSKESARKDSSDESRTSKAEARLQHLESLVQTVLSSTPSTNGSGTGSTSTGSDGSHETSNGTSSYAGATHYSAMLEDIEELRQCLGEDDAGPGTSPPAHEAIADETDVLFGGSQRLPLASLLASHLPPKQEVDRRIAAYFRAEAIAAPFIHVPQFMRQYERFWANQLETPPLWISILFSICHLSQSTGRGAGVTRAMEGSPNGHTSRNFSFAAAHCLALGRYSRPQRFSVEALGVYIQAKIIASLDASRDIGILFGTLIQLAYCQGYHRDPDVFPLLTPFQGEMRRRAWTYCVQLDLLNSFQLGLPNNVSFGSWDSRMPANLRDIDFDEDTIALPPERPHTDHTKVSFYTAKHMLLTIFDKILKHSLSLTGPKPESELIALSNELDEAYNSIPQVFHYRSVATSLSDPVYLVTTRKCVELMYQKCRCVLHRPYITTGRLRSAWTCYEAASTMVKSFLELYPEWKPGGQFYEDRWLLGSITWSDFLLGVMSLCLILCQYRKSAVPNLSDEQIQEIMQMLRACREVCEERAEESTGAVRTKRLLETLFEQIESEPLKQQQQQRSYQVFEVQDTPRPVMGDGFLQQVQDVEMGQGPQGWFDPFSNVFDTQEWSFLEDCLNTNFIDS